MKRSASHHRDAPASSGPWKSLKFSAAMLAASVGLEVRGHEVPHAADSNGNQAVLSDRSPTNQECVFDSLIYPGVGSAKAQSKAVIDPGEKYAVLLSLFEQLKNLPIPESFTPGARYPEGSPDAKVHHLVREMATTYCELLNTHRGFVGRNTPSFPFLGKLITWTREGTITLPHKDAVPSQVRAAIELMWECELSDAISQGGKSYSVEFVMDQLKGNRQAWAATNNMGASIPDLVDARSIPASWSFSQHTLYALGITNWAASKLASGEPLQTQDRTIIQKALSEMCAQPALDLSRIARGNNNGVDISQIGLWSKIFALRVLGDVEDHQELIELLPENLRKGTNRGIVKRSLQDGVLRDVLAFKKDPKLNVGLGGSFFHTTMTFSALSSLRPDQQEVVVPDYLEVLAKAGSTDDVWPYDPTRGFHVAETPRSSAGRGMPIHYCRFLFKPSTENAQKAISALDQFYNYSGTLQANVSREGTHAGPDRIAPYYWAPGLYYAGRLCLELSRRPDLLSPQDVTRLALVTEKITTSALASFDPRHRIITHPGIGTFQQTGPTFSTALTMAAFRDLAQTRSALTSALTPKEIPPATTDGGTPESP